MTRARSIVMAALVAGLAISCTNPMRDTLEAVVQQFSTAQYELNFHDNAGIADTSVIVITFSESMDTDTLDLGGTLFAESDGGVWSEGEFPDDTLTISPDTVWTQGGNRTLTVDVDDLQTYPSADISLSYGVLNGVVYVHPNGSDDNYGTFDQPKATIQAAIDDAEAAYDGAEVWVAGGDYPIADRLLIVEDVSLQGGYSPTDWSGPDPDIHTTTVRDTRGTGSNEVITYLTDVTSSVALSGFDLRAGGGTASVVVFCDGGSPSITDNRIAIGNATTSYGIVAANGSAAEIQNNVIEASLLETRQVGIAGDESDLVIFGNTISTAGARDFFGINLTSSSADIVGNFISGGVQTIQSQGVVLTESTVLMRNNVIDPGSIINDSDPLDLYGVFAIQSDIVLQNNTITGGTGSSVNGEVMATALMLFQGGSSEIVNNIFLTGAADLRTGVWQHSADSLPTVFRGNLMFGNTDGNYYYELTNDAYVDDVERLEDDLTILGVSEVGNNLFGPDPLLSAVDYSFTGSSPPEVTTGGVDLSAEWVGATDILGTTRTPPWSMGAYEKD